MARAVSAALHTPNLGGALPQVAHNSSPVTTDPPRESFDLSNWNMKHEKSMKLGALRKEKSLCITVTLGLFECKVFIHYNCCWGPLWKQSSLLIR